jgi:hypothetical protein
MLGIRHPARMGLYVITTSSLSLSRQLWRYGEPELAERALELSPEEIADIGVRAGAISGSSEVDAAWPAGPRNKELLVAAIERLEGMMRACVRSKRLPEKSLPNHLQATEAELWASVQVVSVVMDSRLHGTE